MKRYLLGLVLCIMLLLPGTIRADTEVIGGGNGVQTDTNCDQAKYYPNGILCQDTDDDKLYKGTGAAVEEIASGTGDVASVGDCTTGACLDGTSDGGTSISLYGGALTKKTTIQPQNTAADVVITLPAATGTLLTTTGTPAGLVIASQATGDLLYASSASAWSRLAAGGTAGMYLRSAGAGAAPVWSTLILPNSGTIYKLAAYSAANTLTELVAVGGTGEILIGNTGALPTWSASPTVGTLTAGSANSITVGTDSAGGVPAIGSIIFHNATNTNHFSLISGTTGAALSWTLPTAAPAGNNYLLNAQTTGVLGYTDPATFSVAAGSSSIVTTGALSSGSLTTGFTPVTVPLGGTGASTYALNGVLYGNAANAIGVTAIGAAGQLLRAGASPFVPAWSTFTMEDTYVQYSIPYASTTNTLTALAPVNDSLIGYNSSGVLAAYTNHTHKNDSYNFVDSVDVTKTMTISPLGMTTGKGLTIKGSFDQSATIDLVNTGLSADSKTVTMALACTDNCTYSFPAATATISYTVASGTSALGTGAIASGDHATLVSTAATGVATTDVIQWGFNADVHGITGYAPSANGMLTIIAYPTSGYVNFLVVNNTGASITPGSAVTLNWRVAR